MPRRKLFRFKLTKKQKHGIIVYTTMMLCALGIFWFLAHPVATPKSAPRQPRPIPTVAPRKTFAPRAPVIPAVTPRPTPKPVNPSLRRFKLQPKVTFVIDDIGYHLRDRDRLAALSDKVTYAVLPLLP